MKRLLTALALGLTLAFAGPAGAASKKSAPDGCAWGILQNVLDGDTVDAFYRTNDPIIWVRPSIRIRGIDTPEKGRWAKCPSEDHPGPARKSLPQFRPRTRDPRLDGDATVDLQGGHRQICQAPGRGCAVPPQTALAGRRRPDDRKGATPSLMTAARSTTGAPVSTRAYARPATMGPPEP